MPSQRTTEEMLPIDSDSDPVRYARQIKIDGWGVSSQDKLKKSTVFIAGAGGLGCPVAVNCATAGIGKIILCDSDTVELSNLNRQFLHTEKNIGKEKTSSAYQALSRRNSHIALMPISEKITSDTVDDLVAGADLILDCLDNFPARYALNQCSIRKNIPLVHGAIWGMEGRVAFFAPPETPCLSCLFPVAPAPEEGGIPVLGAVASATGSIQALEAIRYLAGFEPSLLGRLMIMDYSTMESQTLDISARSSCPDCGEV